jgi:proteasome lid subunit RPN8/RPN11
LHRRRDGHRHGCGGAIAARIARKALDEIAAHARDAQPAECCGILLGKGTEVVEAVRIRNIADDVNRFELDPREHINARRDARSRGLDVIGFYHSHPHSEPEPSPTDLANAFYPEHLYLIVRLLDTHVHARLFRQEGARFVELPFTSDDK